MQYIIRGINDDVTECARCGKQHLRRVVWLENTETGDILPYGTTCAAKLQKITTKEQRQNETTYERELQARNKKLALAAIAPYRQRELAAVAAAPKIGDPGFTMQKRLEYIKNHPDCIAYDQKAKELQNEYGFSVRGRC